MKFAAATANHELGKLTGSGKNPLNDEQVEALMNATREVAAGKFDDQFPIDVFQTGSGTSSNMNANEVISNRAIELTGGDRFRAEKPIHPNDHVNMGQSTNDMFPTAIHVAVALSIQKELIPALKRLHDVLADKARAWDDIIKIGRTHLADATPIRLGQEFSGYARQLALSVERAQRALAAVCELPVGGTAVGTGINTHPQFGAKVAAVAGKRDRIPFVEAVNHFEGNANRDGLVECSGDLRAIAVSLFSMSNNIRWLGSGPRCGFYEVMLPDRQPGSSIMPGKVNPVMCESMMQVCAYVMGNDQTIAFSGATGGNFELNIMMPVMGMTALESCRLLASVTNAFVDFCALEMEANRRTVRGLGRREPGDGDQPQPAHRLRKGGRAGERSIQDRQNHSRTVPRSKDSTGRRAQRSARSATHDRAALAPGLGYLMCAHDKEVTFGNKEVHDHEYSHSMDGNRSGGIAAVRHCTTLGCR